MSYGICSTCCGQSGQTTALQGCSSSAAELVQEHWLFCSLYTIDTKHIKKHILKLYAKSVTLIQTRKQRQSDSFQARAVGFNERIKQLVDVFYQDSEIHKKMELQYGVKMGEMEWMNMIERRRWDIQSLEGMRAECEKEKEISVSCIL
ncbi:uncharacterized protein LOC143035626 [Oratosquilla oratoria]|uniref:uncharacterized protein LOC143023076 n=1 Tax=Oratosquilla oratoria TaxID=337810 RepID=UPI003F76358D